jgi:hypothetical protein
MEARREILAWPNKTTRIGLYTVCAMVITLLLFLWLVFWYDDIMSNNPPASPYENAFSWVCTLALWPFVIVDLLLGRDPPQVYWLLLWVLGGMSWGFLHESCNQHCSANAAPSLCQRQLEAPGLMSNSVKSLRHAMSTSK